MYIAVKDLLFMIGLWFIGRADQQVLAKLLYNWSEGIKKSNLIKS